MNLTITELRSIPCTKCSGRGRIPQFAHRNGGECFRCGATSIDPVMVATTRDMTDDEVVSALDMAGFPIIVPAAADGFLGLFMSDAQIDARVTMMSGARSFLAAL
jgi:hypothetical protein